MNISDEFVFLPTLDAGFSLPTTSIAPKKCWLGKLFFSADFEGGSLSFSECDHPN